MFPEMESTNWTPDLFVDDFEVTGKVGRFELTNTISLSALYTSSSITLISQRS